jgi:ribonuclease BN (tRNA processing enzyme)
VRLTVIASSPAWPNPGGAQSGYLVEGPGRLLLDCGPGVLARLREDSPWPRVDAIAITHFHLDHCGDLVPWVWGALAGPGEGERPELHVPPGGREKLAELARCLGGFPDMFDRTFRVAEYAAGETASIAGFEVFPLRMQHYSMSSFGFRVSNGDSVLAYSGDSGPSDALVELARGADVFLCEATLADGGPAEGEPRGHMTLAEAQAAFQAAGARRLVVTHRPDERPLEREVELARDGLVLDL